MSLEVDIRFQCDVSGFQEGVRYARALILYERCLDGRHSRAIRDRLRDAIYDFKERASWEVDQ